MARRVEFRVLGPLEARVEGAPAPLGGPKQRALLALLLLNRNEAVSTDRLLDGLWGERPPPSAAKVVQQYVSRLRRVLEADGADEKLLVTRAPGYMLRVAPGELDLERFEVLTEQARRAQAAGDPAAAGAALREALMLWRGPPLADLTYEPFAQASVQRLEEQRLAALEGRIEADLGMGQHAALSGELGALIADHPYREELRRQLVVALYRSGRQAEALEAARGARRALDELGLEPSPALADLERRVLNQDAGLAATPPPPAPLEGAAAAGAPPFTAEPPRPRRVRRLLAAAAAGIVVAGAVALVLETRGGSASPIVPAPNTVSRLDEARGAFVASVPVGAAPSGVAVGGGSVWVINSADRTLSRVDLRTSAVSPGEAVGGPPTGIAYGGGRLWVSAGFGLEGGMGGVEAIDPANASVTQTVPVGDGSAGLAVGAGAVWVANRIDGALTPIDALTYAPGRRVEVGGGPERVAVGAGSVWATDPPGHSVVRLRGRERLPSRFPLGGAAPADVAIGFGAVWVSASDNTVIRLEPDSGQIVTRIPVGEGPGALAIGRTGVWVADVRAGDVERIDPGTNEVVARRTVRGAPSALAAAAGSVWVTVSGR